MAQRSKRAAEAGRQKGKRRPRHSKDFSFAETIQDSIKTDPSDMSDVDRSHSENVFVSAAMEVVEALLVGGSLTVLISVAVVRNSRSQKRYCSPRYRDM